MLCHLQIKSLFLPFLTYVDIIFSSCYIALTRHFSTCEIETVGYTSLLLFWVLEENIPALFLCHSDSKVAPVILTYWDSNPGLLLNVWTGLCG